MTFSAAVQEIAALYIEARDNAQAHANKGSSRQLTCYWTDQQRITRHSEFWKR